METKREIQVIRDNVIIFTNGSRLMKKFGKDPEWEIFIKDFKSKHKVGDVVELEGRIDVKWWEILFRPYVRYNPIGSIITIISLLVIIYYLTKLLLGDKFVKKL